MDKSRANANFAGQQNCGEMVITSLVLTVIRKQNKNGQKKLFPRDFDSFFTVQGNKLRDYIKYRLYTHIYGKLKLAILSPGKQFQRYVLRFLN